jgi:hypothetical protein
MVMPAGCAKYSNDKIRMAVQKQRKNPRRCRGEFELAVDLQRDHQHFLWQYRFGSFSVSRTWE